MDSTANTVLQFVEQFWHGVLGNRTVLLDVSEGRSVYHVTDGETFDGLILGDAFTAVRAAESDGMTTSFLVSTTVPTLLGHF
jgi:hypothetical protein